jgi:hypothetical protein
MEEKEIYKKAQGYAATLGPYLDKHSAIEDYTCGYAQALKDSTNIEIGSTAEQWALDRAFVIETLKHLVDLGSDNSEFYSVAIARSMLQRLQG